MITHDEAGKCYRVYDADGTEQGAFKNMCEARECELKYLQQRAEGGCTAVDGDMLFDELMDIFLAEKRVRVRQTTYISYETITRRFIRPAFGGMRVRDITPAMVRAWQNRISQLGYKPQYLRLIDCKLGTVLSYAVRFGGLTSNPAVLAGNIGSWKTEHIQFWTLDEYRQFMTANMREDVRLAFEMLYWTGMRVGELLALTPADFDFEERSVSITKTFRRSGGRDIITPTKTKKSTRVVYVHDSLNEKVRKYIKSRAGSITAQAEGTRAGSITAQAEGTRAGSGTARGEDASAGIDLTVTEGTGAGRIFGFTSETLYGAMRRGSRQTQVKRIKLHDLRHSHASLLIEMNVTPLLIAERLGHEKVETTLNIYSHLYPNRQQELAGRLELLS